MDINTKYFSKITCSQNEVITFKDGLFGFEEEKDYIIIRFENNNDSLLCLQSVTDSNLAFVIMKPLNFISDYKPSIYEHDLADVGATSITETIIYTICVIRDNIDESTVNLRCPLILNPNNRKAKQIILDDTGYFFKHPFSQLIKMEG